MEITNLDIKINRSRSNVLKYQNQVIEEKDRLHKLRLEQFFEKFGIEIGSIVEVSICGKMRIGKVKEIETDSITINKPWVKGFLKNSNGSFGIQLRHFFHYWELIK